MRLNVARHGAARRALLRALPGPAVHRTFKAPEAVQKTAGCARAQPAGNWPTFDSGTPELPQVKLEPYTPQ